MTTEFRVPGTAPRRPRVLSALMVVLTAMAGLMVMAPAASATSFVETPRQSWSPTNGTVYALARVGNTLVMGGSFTAIRSPNNATTVTRNRLAAIDLTTGALLDWNPNANGDVRALVPSADGQSVYAGGGFTTIGGSGANRIVALDITTGARTPGFTASVNGADVRALARAGNTLYLGGGFQTVNGTARQRLAAISATTGALVTGFTASADAQVNALAVLGDRLVVGGRFRSLSGQPRDYLGSVALTSGAATSWRTPIPCTDVQNPCFVLDLDVTPGMVYAAIGGPGGRAAAYDATTGNRRWAAYGDGDVQAVEVSGNILYVGGHFNPVFGNQQRGGIAALNIATGAVLSDFAPQIVGALGVWDILDAGPRLAVGGEFTQVRLPGGATTGEMRYTDFAAIGMGNDTTPPSTPTGLTAINTFDRRTTLTWNPSTDDQVMGGYEVFRDGTKVEDVGVTTFTDTTLAPDTTYRFRVRALDATGNTSPLSAELTVRTLPPSTSLVPAGSTWRYLSNGSDQGTAWRAPGFSDSSWSVGPAQFGFGDGDEQTVISPLGRAHYFRRTFTVPNAGSVSGLVLRLLRDDGAVVYINGTEVARSNMPSGTITATTLASSEVPTAEESTYHVIPVSAASLVSGTNVVAVEVHDASASNQDLSFDLDLATNQPSVPAPDTVAPSQPGNLRTTSVTATGATLAWDASTDNVGVTGYRVSRNGTLLTTVTGTTYTATGLTANTAYQFSVVAVDAAGNQSPAANLTVTPSSTPTPPAPPGTPGTVFQDTWTQPDGQAWGPAWAVTSANGSAQAQGGAGRLAINDVANAYARAQLAGVPNRADTDLTFSYQWSSGTARAYLTAAVRGSGGWLNGLQPRNGYSVQVQSDAGSVVVRKTVNGIATNLTTLNAANQVGTARHWVRLRAEGSTISVKVWTGTAANEPAAWRWTGTDTTVTAPGQVHLSLSRGSANVGTKHVNIDDLVYSETDADRVPAPDTVAPSQPGNLRTTSVTATGATLAWDASTDNVGVTGYRVSRNGTLLTTVTGTTYTATGLTANTAYQFSVVAVDAAGNQSPAANLTVTPSTTPTPPTPPGPGTVFQDTWTQPDGQAWGPAWAATSANGSAQAQGGAGRLSINDVANAYARAQLAGVPNRADTDLTFSYQWSSGAARAYLTAAVRGSGGWLNGLQPRNGYSVQVQSDAGSVVVRKTVNGIATNLTTLNAANQVGTARQWVRLRVQGSTISVKVWTGTAANEPAAWRWTGTDTTVTAPGQVHLSLSRGSANVGAKHVNIDDLTYREAN